MRGREERGERVRERERESGERERRKEREREDVQRKMSYTVKGEREGDWSLLQDQGPLLGSPLPDPPHLARDHSRTTDAVAVVMTA